MNRWRIISPAILFLCLGGIASAQGQQEPQQHNQDKTKPPQGQKAPPPRQQSQHAPPQQQRQQPPQQKQQQQARNQQNQNQQHQQAQQKQQQQQQARNQQNQNQQHQQAQQKQQQQQSARNQTNQQHQQQQAHDQQGHPQHAQRTSSEIRRQESVPALRLSVRGEGRIPDDRFRSNFGRGHTFRIGSPSFVGGYSRFQYGGFWFGFVDPWPRGWYYTDDVYIDYIDGGYYMYDPYYPGARIAISVVL